jgi:hypothetical protein
LILVNIALAAEYYFSSAIAASPGSMPGNAAAT